MRTEIPNNNVSIDYKNILDNFITSLVNKQKNNLISVYMNGSYARGDATDLSDLDIFCIFAHLDNNVLNDVGDTTRNTTILFGKFEINSQCFSLNEIEDPSFINWREKSVRILDSVFLLIEYFRNQEKLDNDIKTNHKLVLEKMQSLVLSMLNM